MAADGATIKSRIRSLLRSPSIKLRRSKAQHKENLGSKVVLEKVLGITAPGNRALACDPRSGLVAYPAGCVVVLLNPKKNKQHHIFNHSRKTITTLAFSPDGKYIVTGESGHMPAVRVWDVSECVQVVALQEHKYGVSCVAFSPNSKYIVSVGYHHDMIINVWSWKKNVVVSSNKVSSRVTAVSFSDDSSYFVTAGNRHVKFWYLDHTKTSKVSSTVPLSGRSGLLGELRNNFFSDVACGRGKQAASTYCITSSGLLCEFNERRLLDKWVELRRVDSVTTCQATCVCVTEELLFCGCADGTVRAFSPVTLHFLFTMPRPHHLGCDISSLRHASQLFATQTSVRYPDAVCVSYDPTNRWLSCVYSDHSVYVWDVRDPQRPGKLCSALYHSACVWGLEVCPEGGGGAGGGGHLPLPPGSFLTCSGDNTIRLWNTDGLNTPKNILSQDLVSVIYTDPSLAGLTDTEGVAQGNQEKAGSGAEPQTSETRAGLRTLCISPDGRHLASGDRMGILRIHDTENMEEILNVQAHDSEILCLEYSQPDTGLRLLATASRDRLIHVLDAARDYSLLQTLDEHSSSITAVRFAAHEGKVRLVSCGADKSIYFRTAHKTEEGMEFSRTHHVVRKTTLYDMDIDSTRKYAAIGCQDRSIRIFNISNGKQKKMYKGSQGEDGTLIKVQTDPSGLYIATSCSDKNISIFNFYSGECVATMYGHSEIVTGMKFTNDCKHLITVSGDSCIFVWRLSPDLTISMLQRLADLRPQNKTPQYNPRRDLHGSSPIVNMSSDSDKEEEEDEEGGVSSGRQAEITVGTQQEKASQKSPDSRKGASRTPRRRWSRRAETADRLMGVQSMLDLRHLDRHADPDQSPDQDQDLGQDLGQPGPDNLRPPHFKDRPLDAQRGEELGSTVSLQVTSTWAEDGGMRTRERPGYIRLSPEVDERVVYPPCWEDRVSLGGEFQVKEVLEGPQRGGPDEPSPDSACSLGYCPSASPPCSPPTHSHTQGGWENMEGLGMDGNSSDLEEEEEAAGGGRGGGAAGAGGAGGGGGGGVQGRKLAPQTPDQEAFLKQHFVTLADDTPSGSPSRSVQSSSENLSISSRFHCQGTQNPPPRRSVFPFSSETPSQAGAGVGGGEDAGGGGGGGGGGAKGSRVQVSEVRPLNQPSEAWARKKPLGGAESKRSVGGVARGVASYLSSSSGLRKAKSVQSLMPDAAEKPISRPSREVAPLPQRPTTLPSSPRRPAPSTLPTSPRPRPYPLAVCPVAINNSSSNSAAKLSPVSASIHASVVASNVTASNIASSPVASSPVASSVASSDAYGGAVSFPASDGTASGGPRRASRSYMSPTTSSMAKMSRSASLGDGLDTLAEDRPPGGGACPLATPPSASVVPTLISGPSVAVSSSFGNHGNLQAKLSVEFGHALPDKLSLAAFSPAARTACSSSSSSPAALRTPQGPQAPAQSSTSETWNEGEVPIEELHHQTTQAPVQSSTSEAWSEDVVPTAELHHQTSRAPVQSSTSEPWSVEVVPTVELHHQTSTSEPWSEEVVPTLELHQSSRAPVQSSTSEPWSEAMVPTEELHHQTPAQSSTSESWTEEGGISPMELPHKAPAQASTLEPWRERAVPTAELHVQALETSQDEKRGDDETSVSLEVCRAAAAELQRTFRRAAHLHSLVSSSSAPASAADKQEMNEVLSEAFGSLRAELNTPTLGRLDPQCMLGGEQRALDLLERYSQLLLQAVEKKLDPH